MSHAKPKHSFGSKVAFRAKFVRIEREGRRRYWIHMPIKRTEGIFLGYRTLSNGVVQTDSVGGPVWVPNIHFVVFLVCPSRTQNPLYVPRYCLEAIE